MNRQHLTRAFSVKVPVIYAQEPMSWSHSRARRDEMWVRAGTKSIDDRLRLLQLPKLLAFRHREGVYNQSVRSVKARIIEHCAASRPLILYLWDAALWRYANAIRADLVVFHIYDVVDAQTKPPTTNNKSAFDFQQACNAADVVIAGTKAQAACVTNKQAVIVPNGVHVDWYLETHDEPPDLREISRPRIGYVGSISSKLDFDLLLRLSEEDQWQIVLVGPIRSIHETDVEKLKQLQSRPNVHYLGNKDATLVPSYIRRLDVGLTPYRRALHCERASPLKLYEYAAAGLPVVGSRLASLTDDIEIQRIARLVDTPEQAVIAVRRAVANSQDPTERRARVEFAKRNSWSQRAETILSLIRSSI